MMLVHPGARTTRKTAAHVPLTTGVVDDGVVDPGGADVVALLPLGGCRVGEVDDIEDPRPAEAGDLHGSHAVRLGPTPVGGRRVGQPQSAFLAVDSWRRPETTLRLDRRG